MILYILSPRPRLSARKFDWYSDKTDFLFFHLLPEEKDENIHKCKSWLETISRRRIHRHHHFTAYLHKKKPMQKKHSTIE